MLLIICAIAQSEQPYYHSFEEMKAWVEKVIQIDSLLVLLFHGVGGGNSLDVSVSVAVFRQRLLYINQKRDPDSPDSRSGRIYQATAIRN